MDKWMNERDLLLAETLDYVHRVAARSKIAALPEKSPAPKTQSFIPEQSFTPKQNASPKKDPLTPIAASLPAFDRSEIKARLVNFKATQLKFQRAREEFFARTMAEARADRRDRADGMMVTPSRSHS